MDDITFCCDDCQVFRCERHPGNIMHPELPHSFANLYQTEYCLLGRQVPKEKIEIVRCKDCVHNKSAADSGNANCELYYGMTDQMGFCHMGERRDE